MGRSENRKKRKEKLGEQMMWDLAEHEYIGIRSDSKVKIKEDFKLGNGTVLFAFYENHFLKIRQGTVNSARLKLRNPQFHEW